MTDRFESFSPGLTGPATDALALTPNDAADLPLVGRALYVGGGGDLRLVTSGGSDVLLRGVAGGSVLPVRARRVMATGTTATHLVSLV